jgi:uncharacterized protein
MSIRGGGFMKIRLLQVGPSTYMDLARRTVMRIRSSSLTVDVARRTTESDAATRRRVLVGVSIAGAGLLGASLSTKPGSWRFYPLTLGVAGTWMVGGLCSGRPKDAQSQDRTDLPSQPMLVPIAIGAGAFGAFYGAALIARRVPFLNDALIAVMDYAHRNSGPLVVATTLANAIGEEVFFRGAIYDAAGTKHPHTTSTVAYMAVTTATRNPALVLASGAMGTVFALQRRASGGIEAPILTHLTWSALMLCYLPPLFQAPPTMTRDH